MQQSSHTQGQSRGLDTRGTVEDLKNNAAGVAQNVPSRV